MIVTLIESIEHGLANKYTPDFGADELAEILAALKRMSPEGAGGQVTNGHQWWVMVPVEPPPSIPDPKVEGTEYDEELFMLCRNSDYPGLYRALIKRVGQERAPQERQ